MTTLKEILDDKTQYGDNIAFTLASGVNTTLGQLRNLRAEDQSAISRKEAELTTQGTTLKTQQEELKRAQLNTASAYTLIQQATADIKAGKYDSAAVKQLFPDGGVPGVRDNNTNSDPFAALSRLENDALLAPLVQVIKAVDANSRKAEAAVANNLKIQETMATNYLNGVLEDRYDRYVPTDKQDKFPLGTLIQNAVNAKQFRSDGTPDIKRAYKDMTSGDDAAARETQIRADERKKVTDEIAAKGGGEGGIFVGTPGASSFGLDVHNRSGKAPQPFKSLDDAFAAAAKDKDIWANVDGTVQ